MAAPTYWTAEMVRDLPEDGNRYEVVYGELLVTPAPRPWHEVLVQRLIVAIDAYLRREPVGIVLGSRADISWGPDVLVQPDVFVVPLAQARTLDWAQYRDLLLVAEVLSSSSARSDRFQKRRRYQEAGIPVYWIVDGDQRQAEVWTPDARFPLMERERLSWHPGGATTGLSLSLEDLFRPLYRGQAAAPRACASRTERALKLDGLTPTSLLLALTIAGGAARFVPEQSPQAVEPYRITGMSARLYYHDRDGFSEDVLSRPELGLWNTPTGAGEAGGPSAATFVVVKVSGPAGRFVPGRRVLLVATSPAGTMRQSVETEVLSADGTFYAGFWLYDTGCLPVQLSARLTGQTAVTEAKGRINFRCGE